MPQALALALLIGSLVLIRGGTKGLGPTDAFKDVFSRVPRLGVSPPTPGGHSGQIGAIGVGQYPPDVERWRTTVEKYFGPKTPEALSVMYCESRGNPSAVNPDSQASGLFQHLPKYWPQRAKAAGFPGANIFDPEANIATAAYLFNSRTVPWQDWSCKPSVIVSGGGGGGGGTNK